MPHQSFIRKYAIILLGNLLVAIGVALFVSPFGIITGGVGGLALLVEKFTSVPMSITTMILNVLLFLLGLWCLGKSFTISTALSTFVYPIFLWGLEQFPSLSTLCPDITLASIFSGLLMGLGLGLVMREGASTGGMDIPPLIVYRRTHISLGALVALFDYAVLLCQVPFYNPKEILYGTLSVLVSSLTINEVMLSSNDKMQLLVISPAYQQIREVLLKMDLGVTMMDVKTGLQLEAQQAVLSIFSQRRLTVIQERVLEIDPNAFLITSRVAEVHGRGFTKARYYSDWMESES